MVAQGAPVTVVDYDCPEGSGAWVQSAFPDVTVVQVKDDSGFSVARARNIGATHIQTDWIAFVDADVILPMGLLSNPAEYELQGVFTRYVSQGHASEQNTWGTCIVEKAYFGSVGGYDETFRGWGGEDDDLYQRLKMSGLRERQIQDAGLGAIPHTDHLRTAYYEQKDKVLSFIESRLYREAKYFVMRFYGVNSELPLETRIAIRSKVSDCMRPWIETNCDSDFEFHLKLNQIQNLCSTHQLSASAELKLSLPRIAKEVGA
jgi:glycosyltransferase involved in cell wall biosynthesis